ncbi:glycosyltransferase family 4 protein [Spirosoma horti]
MSLAHYVLLALFLIGAEALYILFARWAGLFDKPNGRSAHQNETTVRAGGFVFYPAVMVAIGSGEANRLYLGAGLTAIMIVSFWDDVSSVPKRYRLAIHVLAVGLLLMQERGALSSWYFVAGLLVLGVGIVNAYNFMDGINGMTAFYSLITVVTLWFWQARLPAETDNLFPCLCIALLIFGYVNARRQALCFAGDVGSITMGFMVLYSLLEMINQSHTYLPILFLSVYGVDTGTTLVYRLYLRQNIFRAHRLHLFQLLVHQTHWSHLPVSALYAAIQVGINILVLMAMQWPPTSQFLLAGAVLGSLTLACVWARNRAGKLKEVGFEKPTSHQV